ncbi:MAG: hypothetical protein IT178_01475 [Acidobacteria bacterium]|nr:hypothetical protein [Acidobacteriota bacterium]
MGRSFVETNTMITAVARPCSHARTRRAGRLRRSSVVATLCVALSLAACGSDDAASPLAPSPVPLTGALSGTWTGTLRAGNRETRLTLTLTDMIVDDRRGGIFGTYTAQFPGLSDIGNLSGVREDAKVSLMLVPASSTPCAQETPLPPNAMLLSANLSGSRFEGTGVVVDCNGSTNWTATFDKQP